MLRVGESIRRRCQQLAQRVRRDEHAYLLARLGMGVLRDGYPETKRRYQIYHYEQLIEKDGEGKPLLLYSEREKLLSDYPTRASICIIAILRDTPESQVTAWMNAIAVQACPDWKLILWDRNDESHAAASGLLRRNAKKDKHIIYRKVAAEARSNAEIFAETLRRYPAEYYVYLTQDCLLHPTALYRMAGCLEATGADLIYTDEAATDHGLADAGKPFYKPDYAPDTLRSYNYIGTFFAFRASLAAEVASTLQRGIREPGYDLLLRLTELTEKIIHIPEVLCCYYNHEAGAVGHFSRLPFDSREERMAVEAHLRRLSLQGSVRQGALPATNRINYVIAGRPKVSIIIPNRDHAEDLRACIQSIREKSTWDNWEIIVIENGSQLQSTWRYYEELRTEPRVKIEAWYEEFNYSRICNFGATFAQGDYILLLNNDTEVIAADWMEQMLMYAQRTDVGAVGAKLYYPNDTIQHAGVVIDPISTSFHCFRNLPWKDPGYAGRLMVVQDLSACTGACLMVKKTLWDRLQGLDEDFAISYNDIDLCMRLRAEGLLIVWTPYAELYHHEQKSRGQNDTPEKIALARREAEQFRARWGAEIEAGDPYYNANLKAEEASWPDFG